MLLERGEVSKSHGAKQDKQFLQFCNSSRIKEIGEGDCLRNRRVIVRKDLVYTGYPEKCMSV